MKVAFTQHFPTQAFTPRRPESMEWGVDPESGEQAAFVEYLGLARR
jgi:hypothetical protein